jgi:M6 family metalloprotease-like protein
MSHPRFTLRVLLSSFLFVSAALLPGTVFAHGANTKVHHVSPAVVQELQTLTTGLVAADQPLLSAEAAAAQNALGQQVNIAARRSALMEQVAAEDPTVFLQNVLPSSIREQLPPAVQLIIEQPVTLTGVMEVLHVDDFSNSDNSHFTYHMRVGDVRLAFYPVGTPPAMSSGSTAQVTGYRIGQSVVAVGGSGGVEVLEQALPDATGVQRTLAVLVTAPGKPILLTPAQVKAAVFSRGFQAFYKEQSYNKVSFTGDTTEWITVPAYATDMCYGGGSLISLSQTEIQNYFVTKNIDLSQYGRVVLLINGLSGGCAYVGKVGQMVNNKTYTLSLGWVGSPTSVPAAGTPGLTMFEYVLAHEVGHELGVMHANAWHCAGPSLDVDCTHAEYGNGYDVMGGGYSVSHFNAFYKNLLGWLDDASKVSITTAGTYTIAPLETASGLRAGIITNPGSPTAQPLYVEYRRPIGFDAGLVPASIGLFLNQVIAPSTAFPFPRLLNANYATTNIGGQMQPLTQGGVFSWNTRGIKITANTVATSSATFDVVFTPPICTRVGITAINVYASAPVLLGGIGYVQFEAINNDTVGCPSSTISIAPSIAPSTGTTLSQYPTGSVTLAPGESSYFTVWFYTSQSSLVGESVITTTITDTTNARTHVFSKAVTIVGPNTLPLGYFDAANCTTLSGWAYDPDVASTSINVTVKEGDTILLTTPANKLRNDVNTARNITGKHGFSVSTPLSLKDNKPHTLSAYAVDSNGKDVAQLQLSPKAITCGA